MSEWDRRADPAVLTEMMDEPCSYETLRACLQDLHRVNRLTLSYRPTLRFLERLSADRAGQVLHILDVGCGYGDMLRRVRGWAAQKGVLVKLTGIDLNPFAERAAREATAAAGIPEDAITWVTGDAFSMKFETPVDVILSSLLTHHLSHAELVHFLKWMEATARVGWFVNDLERQMVPGELFGLLARVLRWHRFVQHDGPVSFRRAFRAEDWRALLTEADVTSPEVSIDKVFPARLCVGRMR